jgi:hypothetical protein
MKKTLLLTLLFIFSTIIFAQKSKVVTKTSKGESKPEQVQLSDLPQKPKTTKLKSDAEDEGLKGKIRKIVDESEELSEFPSFKGKKMSSIDYYDEKGNLLRRETFDFRGSPRNSEFFGYIAGKRVSRFKSIGKFENLIDPPPKANDLKVKKPIKPDLNYKFSYKYKYENGKLIEKQMLTNSGETWLRTEYKYSKNKVERFIYSASGELNQNCVVLTDDKGIKLEEVDLDALKIRGIQKYVYKHEFDDNGNWTKQTVELETIIGDKASVKPLYVVYRTITYY